MDQSTTHVTKLVQGDGAEGRWDCTNPDCDYSLILRADPPDAIVLNRGQYVPHRGVHGPGFSMGAVQASPSE